jgi:nicotinamide-nucleotide amidase
LGQALLRAENPIVATYARSDAVDVRISAVAQAGRGPAELVEEAAAAVLAAVGDHVWGRDNETWQAVLGRQLAERAWTAALIEVGTGGSATRLLGEAPWLLSARTLAAEDPTRPLPALAERARQEAGASIGIAVRAVESGEDTRVDLAVAGPWGVSEASQTAFLGGEEGRRRAALAAAAFLHRLAKER